MKSRDAVTPNIPVAPALEDSPSLKHILKKHGASLHIKGGRKSSHKTIAEDLVAALEVEKNRTAVVEANLHAILNQYQVTMASVRQLQEANVQLTLDYNQKLRELEAHESNGNGDDTETEGA
jgi:hypothetical protein